MRCFLFAGLVAALLRGGAVVRSEEDAEVGVPAFDKVLTMLDNLVKQLDEEGQTDEADYQAFMTWYGTAHSSTSASIGALSNRLSELGATLADLRARQRTLSSNVQRLSTELDHERGQLQEAQQKRQEEHASFVAEQSDFDNSIAACNKAVSLLGDHYGDGKPKEISKPAWMSLVGVLRSVHKAVSKHHAKVPAQLTSLLQASYHRPAEALNLLQGGIPQAPGSSLYDAYQDKTGEALGIVAQIKDLAQTFAEDKQEAIDAENDLQAAFNAVLQKKTEMINSLSSQLAQQQSVLNQVNQEIGENENAEQTAQGQLQMEQTYLSDIETQERDLTAMYEQRQKDRAEERTAVQAAVQVLMAKAPQLLQLSRSARHAKALLQLAPGNTCKSCRRAEKLLRTSAGKLKSTLLATAAAMAGSSSTLGPVIQQLQGLLQRLDEQGEQERKHKEWCESEQTEANNKKQHHDGNVVRLQGEIEDTNGVIAEKQQGLVDTADAVSSLDSSFNEVTATREKAKADYEAEHADYVAAIQALNQAIDILGDFYREQQDLVQVKAKTVRKAGQPDTSRLTSSYSKAGSSSVVTVLSDTRKDFEHGKENIELFEQKAAADYEADKSTYNANRASLVDAGNRLSAELQTAKAALSQLQEDLTSNQAASASAAQYLVQLGGSCGALLEHFEDRQSMRAQEREAISNAVGVLQSV